MTEEQRRIKRASAIPKPSYIVERLFSDIISHVHSGKAHETKIKPFNSKLLLLVLTCLIAAILTTAGFFFDSVPFALAYTPFLMALITPSRGYRAALVGGHFVIVFDIAATGLVHMGFSGWLVMFGFLFAVSTLSGLFACLVSGWPP